MRIVLKPSPKRTCSGQVLTEACIGVALIVFFWILMTYSSFMGTNYIRTAMAARYAAWFRGAALKDATSDQVNQLFFRQKNAGVVKVEYVAPETLGSLAGQLTSLLSDAPDTVKNSSGDFTNSEDGPYRASVTFGWDQPSRSDTPFPFDLLRTKPPFMPDAMLPDYLKVSSQCQWDGVGETWKDSGKALKAAFNALKDIVTDFLGL